MDDDKEEEQQMKHEMTEHNGQVVVTLNGSMYVEDAAVVREQLLKYLEQGKSRFLVDMQHLDYIDSSGLGVLVAIHKRALQQGGQVTVGGLRGMVKELFELTRMNKVFAIRD